jgi:hypothetical protein
MLFDMQDYLNAGVIGPNQLPDSAINWTLVRDTAQATRDAMNKIVGQYILETEGVNKLLYSETDPACLAELERAKQRKTEAFDRLVAAHDTFWAAKIAGQRTYYEYNAYSKAVELYVKSIRSLMVILDGDTFKLVQ